MDTKFEKLNSFFDKIKNISFWQRIFGWRKIRNFSYEAYEEFKKLTSSVEHVIEEINQAKETIKILKNDNEHLTSGKTEQEKELALLKEKISQLSNHLIQIERENAGYKQTESDRKGTFATEISNVISVRKQIQEDRQKEQDERQKKEIERIQSMKEMWANHQENVKNTIKSICQSHTIEYVDKVPFKGSPDNTIKICDEFVIFDAKSPASDDLQNFPNYIKAQTESVKKYIKEENVRKDIYLVIPSNSVDVIEQLSYNMGDYNVYVVTLDVLEPLMLNLKKIEDYEFIDQLTPEERVNICRIIGKFAHMSKRRIQIDQFFAWEFLDILTKCKADLPREILDKVIEFEKSEKINPPQERRAKQIAITELESDTEKIKKEAEAKAVIFPPSLQKDLKKLPLYEGEE